MHPLFTPQSMLDIFMKSFLITKVVYRTVKGINTPQDEKQHKHNAVEDVMPTAALTIKHSGIYMNG